MAENFEAQITQAHSELDELKSQGEEVYKQYIDATSQFLKNWYAEITRTYIKKDPDLTAKLGDDKLRELKNDLTALKDESDKIAIQFLLHDKICWHLCSYEEINSMSCDTTRDLFRYREHDDKEILHSLQKAYEKIGEVLKPYGYMPQSYGEKDLKQYSTYRLNWSDPMRESMALYGELYKKAASVSGRIISLNQCKKEIQAEERWDRI